MQLYRFFNLKSGIGFNIDTGSQVVENTKSLPAINYLDLDEYLLIQEQQKVQEQNIRIAQSGRYPALSLSGSFGSGYSGNNKELVGTEFLPKPFNIQVILLFSTSKLAIHFLQTIHF